MRYALAVLAAAAAVKASPFPQAVTAAIAPPAAAPPGCTPAFVGSFGIAVMNISTAAVAKRQATQLADGQPHAGSAVAATQISDGQPQAPTAQSVAPVTQINDGQPQATPNVMTVAHVSQITDGQVQGGMHTVMIMPISQINDGQVQAVTTMAPVTVISDGQPQAPQISATPVAQISDAQPQAPPQNTALAVGEKTEGQPQAPTSISRSAPSQTPAVQPPPTPSSAGPPPNHPVLVACQRESTLAITLADGILKDAKGRTGYIASNFQFQFDGPPQAGAIFTAGFTVCANGSLALGGSNVFWQCRSGDFFNLYDRFWAAQCSPVTLNTLTLKQCT